MRSRIGIGLGALTLWAVQSAALAEPVERRLPVGEYLDRMQAGWIGQMVGVGWGAPTEFKWKARIMPEDRLPRWRPEMVNQFRQDDLYVEMTFLRTLEEHGLEPDIRQAGVDFANSGYPLWHANRAGRDNLRRGIAPPDSGHPRFNSHADDIDYQIEADFSGLIAPGLPNTVIGLGEIFGRLMNYGDGLYGGRFVGAMYAEAFFESNPEALVRAGLRAIPERSQYAECIRDVLAWHREQPEDWEAVWQRVDAKYQKNDAYRRSSCSKGDFNIDAKINGAYIAMGLLYGGRDPEKTIAIACRCGQDSDCNPSNAAGVLFTSLGLKQLPKRFTGSLVRDTRFSHTEYTFARLVEVCETLARQAVAKAGGRVERDATGQEVFVIPQQEPRPGPVEQCRAPGPIADSRFSAEQMAVITARVQTAAAMDINKAAAAFAPGWTVINCGQDMKPGLRQHWGGRETVLVTHPLSLKQPCCLRRDVNILPDRVTTLELVVGHDPRGDWTLVVTANGNDVAREKIGPATCDHGWRTIRIDLSDLAGQTVRLELQNRADGWSWEAGYWDSVALSSR